MNIIELQSHHEFALLYKLIAQLNSKMSEKQFHSLLKEMLPKGYRCIVAVEGNAYVGAAGFWTGTKFWCGRYMEVDNLVVDAHRRGENIGQQLMRWLEVEAQRLGCQLVGLPVYTHNQSAQRFYYREGYGIEGFYFTKWYLS